MTIENFRRVAPPPPAPVGAFSGPWAPIEAELGTALPQDYKDFVRLYGEGSFMEFLGIRVPRSRSPYGQLVAQARAVSRVIREYEEPPYPVWPDAGGLLPVGSTDFGDHIFWLTQGSPDEWKIVVWSRGDLDYEEFDCDLTDFLTGVASEEIVPDGFPDGLFPCESVFQPYPPRNVEFRLSWRTPLALSPASGAGGFPGGWGPARN